jgi:hypothetical protein
VTSLLMPSKRCQTYAGPYEKRYPRGKKTTARHPPCGWATPQTAVRPFGGVDRPQGIEGSGMAGLGETLGSLWIPLPVRACRPMSKSESRQVLSKILSKGLSAFSASGRSRRSLKLFEAMSKTSQSQTKKFSFANNSLRGLCLLLNLSFNDVKC